MNIELIRELSSKLIALPNANPITIYLLEAVNKEPSPNLVARIGGSPIGITSDTWPRFNGKPMEHLITVDLEEMPELKTGTLASARAVALFIDDRMENEVASIIVLSQDEISKGEPSINLRVSDEPASCYKITPVKVPEAVFDDFQIEGGESPLEKLRGAIFSTSIPGYAAGKPLWLQGKEHEGHFLFQFDESFIDVNLGDAGVMYVFTDTALWQCH
jgi:hypothetical protein